MKNYFGNLHDWTTTRWISARASTRNRYSYFFGVLLGAMGLVPPVLLVPTVIGIFGFLWVSESKNLRKRYEFAVWFAVIPFLIFILNSFVCYSRDYMFYPEFLKPLVYGLSFMIGLLGLNRCALRSFSVAAVLMPVFLIIAAQIVYGDNLAGIQDWLLYPPDYNNTAAFVLVFVPFLANWMQGWSKIIVLSISILFGFMIDSRVLVMLIPMFAVYFTTRLPAVLLFGGWMFLFEVKRSIPPPFAFHFRALVAVHLEKLVAYVQKWGANFFREESDLPLIGGDVSHVGGDASHVGGDASHIGGDASHIGGDASHIGGDFTPIPAFGTQSDQIRLDIFRKAIEMLRSQDSTFFVGSPDIAIAKLLNDPPIVQGIVFQHAHNLWFQSIFAGGVTFTVWLLVTLGVIFGAALKRKQFLFAFLVSLLFGLSLLESLISDVRVLTVVFIFFGGLFKNYLISDSHELDSRGGGDFSS